MSFRTLPLLVLLAAAALSGCAARFQVQPADSGARATLERWAASEGKSLRWNADVADLGYEDSKALNRALERATSLSHAVDIFVQQAQAARLTWKGENAAGQRLSACIYTNSVVVAYFPAAVPCVAPLKI